MTPEQTRVEEIIAKHEELERDGSYSYPTDIMELKDIIDSLTAENEVLKEKIRIYDDIDRRQKIKYETTRGSGGY